MADIGALAAARAARVPGDQPYFKQRTDPPGLLSPGKMRDFVPLETSP